MLREVVITTEPVLWRVSVSWLEVAPLTKPRFVLLPLESVSATYACVVMPLRKPYETKQGAARVERTIPLVSELTILPTLSDLSVVTKLQSDPSVS